MRPSGVWMLAADLRFPKPKLLKREFIELIWKEESRGRATGKRVGQISEARERRRTGQDGAGRAGRSGLGGNGAGLGGREGEGERGSGSGQKLAHARGWEGGVRMTS